MQHLKTQPGGTHLCLLTEEEYNYILQRGTSTDTEVVAAWKRLFLHHVASLSPDSWIYNTIARATSQLDLFQDEYGKLMPFETWAIEVMNNRWHVPGLGPNRMAALKDALSQAQVTFIDR